MMGTILSGINLTQILLRLIVTCSLLVIIFGSCFFILLFIRKASKMDFSRSHILHLTNGGNVPSVFRLMVDAPAAALQFAFLMNGIPLGEVPPTQEDTSQDLEPEKEEIEQVGPAPANSSKQPLPAASQTKTQNSKNAVEAGSKAGKAVAEKSGLIASLLGTVGSILPGKAGSALKEQGENARNLQTKTSQTMQMPETAKNKVDAIQKDSNRLGGASKPKNIPARANNSSNTTLISQPQPKTAVSPRVLEKNKALPSRPKMIACQVETQEVAPGETLELTLSIKPLGRKSPEKSISYWIKSQQIPLQRLDREAPQIETRGVVHFEPVSSWRYWLPDILKWTIIFMESLCFFYFFILIWF